MKFFIATDHAGLRLVEFVKAFLLHKGFEIECFLPQAPKADYPDFAQKLCKAVLAHRDSKGILICGTGIGMSISANRFAGIRAALCTDSYMAEMARKHNDANVLCLGERLSGLGVIESILEAFIKTEFEGGRHLPRIQKIEIRNKHV